MHGAADADLLVDGRVVRVAPRAKLRQRRHLVAGDAAHQAAPVGVHSMNSGLVEARELAARMVRILRAGAASLLEEFATETHEAWQWLLGAGREVRASRGGPVGSTDPGKDPRLHSSLGRRPRTASRADRTHGRAARARHRSRHLTPRDALQLRSASRFNNLIVRTTSAA